jgi:dTDP-4-amino-4,6-dideoxygalactose transaminase
VGTIAKKASCTDNFKRPGFQFGRARDGFKAFLKAVKVAKRKHVLLPAYIGWSSREGSGVFDPISELKIAYAFYKVTAGLEIDIDDLRKRLKTGKVSLVVIIHYFGYVDPNYEAAVKLAREYGALVLEDEAHAMLSDLQGGICGRLGDACIYSLHKLFPFRKGGMLVFNDPSCRLIWRIRPPAVRLPGVWDYDMNEISRKRRNNASLLMDLLRPLHKRISPLRKTLNIGEIPQTLPVLTEPGMRDTLYFKLNKEGYGAVSLYHDLINEIPGDEFPVSYALAGRILNLPVHQDINESGLVGMARKIKEILGEK